MMTKQAISVTLSADNVTWLKGRVSAARFKSVSECLDHLVSEARASGRVEPPTSIIGKIKIDPSDPLLETADAAIRSLFRIGPKLLKEKRG